MDPTERAKQLIGGCEAMSATLAEVSNGHKLCRYELDKILAPEGRQQVKILFSSRFAPKGADAERPHIDDIILCLTELLLALCAAVAVERGRCGFYKPF